MLPCFDAYYPQSHYIDINNRGDKDFTWTATVDKDWIKLSASEEWKGKWAENVLRNYSVNRTIHNIDKPGKRILKLWVMDPGVFFKKY
jgi:hypothetical protein